MFHNPFMSPKRESVNPSSRQDQTPTYLLSPITRARIQSLRYDLQVLSPTYSKRFFHVPRHPDGTRTGENAYASRDLIIQFNTLFERINEEKPEIIRNNAALREQFQVALMKLHKKLVELDIIRTQESQPDIKLEDLRTTIIGHHFDNINQFKEYVLSRLETKNHLMVYRYLFPIANSDSETPDELQQNRVKPFMDNIEKTFKLLFTNPKPRISEDSSVKPKKLFSGEDESSDEDEENDTPNPRARLSFA